MPVGQGTTKVVGTKEDWEKDTSLLHDFMSGVPIQRLDSSGRWVDCTSVNGLLEGVSYRRRPKDIQQGVWTRAFTTRMGEGGAVGYGIMAWWGSDQDTPKWPAVDDYNYTEKAKFHAELGELKGEALNAEETKVALYSAVKDRPLLATEVIYQWVPFELLSAILGDINRRQGQEEERSFQSNAIWPAGTCTNQWGNDISSDVHATEEAATNACRMLEKEGFGGEGKVFPLFTWVSSVQSPPVMPDFWKDSAEEKS